MSTTDRALRALEGRVRQHVHPGGRRAAAARRIGETLGFHVLARHYYSPIPDLSELPADVFDRRGAVPGLEIDADAHLALLETALRPYVAEFPEKGPQGYVMRNGGYESVESEVLFAMIRHHRPKKVIEIGTGWSSLVTAAAARANAADGAPVRFISVDPNPSDNLGREVDGSLGVEQWPMPVQDVPIAEFEALEAGDIFFVDGTHTVRTGGDVNFVVLDVLPRLAPGVIVHFHDIYLPWEYPRFFVERYFWNEQYLLQAFLACNPSYEVLFAAHHVARTHPDRLQAAVPNFDRERGPTAFWLRRR